MIRSWVRNMVTPGCRCWLGYSWLSCCVVIDIARKMAHNFPFNLDDGAGHTLVIPGVDRRLHFYLEGFLLRHYVVHAVRGGLARVIPGLRWPYVNSDIRARWLFLPLLLLNQTKDLLPQGFIWGGMKWDMVVHAYNTYEYCTVQHQVPVQLGMHNTVYCMNLLQNRCSPCTV